MNDINTYADALEALKIPVVNKAKNFFFHDQIAKKKYTDLVMYVYNKIISNPEERAILDNAVNVNLKAIKELKELAEYIKFQYGESFTVVPPKGASSKSVGEINFYEIGGVPDYLTKRYPGANSMHLETDPIKLITEIIITSTKKWWGSTGHNGFKIVKDPNLVKAEAEYKQDSLLRDTSTGYKAFIIAGFEDDVNIKERDRLSSYYVDKILRPQLSKKYNLNQVLWGINRDAGLNYVAICTYPCIWDQNQLSGIVKKYVEEEEI